MAGTSLNFFSFFLQTNAASLRCCFVSRPNEKENFPPSQHPDHHLSFCALTGCALNGFALTGFALTGAAFATFALLGFFLTGAVLISLVALVALDF